MVVLKACTLSLFTFAASLATANAACANMPQLVCRKTTSPPTLDADLSEWTPIQGIDTQIDSIAGTPYVEGNLKAKCLYDNERIYFSMQIPGEFSFDTEDNHKCAAIGTMLKVGADATYVNMGGCPDALAPGSCDNGVPDTCLPYLVDIGAHWELRTTTQGQTYPIGTDDGTISRASSGTGDDPVANKDDEYGYSPFCRFDDDGENAGNEWAGAWAYSDANSEYIFELSRLLTTASPGTDAQLAAGESYSFGIAYWDPKETPTGWTDAGHFLTGCGSDWIDLVLQDSTDGPNAKANSAASASNMLAMVAVAFAWVFYL